MQSRLMSHQFSFSSAYNGHFQWTYQELSWGDNLGVIYALNAPGTIETMFNVVPGNLLMIKILQALEYVC